MSPLQRRAKTQQKRQKELAETELDAETGSWGGLKKGTRRHGAHIWGTGKTLLIEKSIAEHWAGRHFGNIAKPRAIRKGELLRGMVSQSRPDPLRLGVKVFRSDPEKRIS
jgi:hypothetical protein